MTSKGYCGFIEQNIKTHLLSINSITIYQASKS